MLKKLYCILFQGHEFEERLCLYKSSPIDMCWQQRYLLVCKHCGKLEYIEDQDEIQKNVLDFLHHLKPRELKVIELRFGLNGNEEHTMREIGEKFNICSQRARQIEAKALQRLRYYKQKRDEQVRIDEMSPILVRQLNESDAELRDRYKKMIKGLKSETNSKT